jgi:hypothetical protein
MVEVPMEIIKEVPFEVAVLREVIVEKEIIKEVETIKEVPVEVIKEVIIDRLIETPL